MFIVEIKHFKSLKNVVLVNGGELCIRWREFNMNELYQVHDTHCHPKLMLMTTFPVSNYPHQSMLCEEQTPPVLMLLVPIEGFTADPKLQSAILHAQDRPLAA